MLKRLRAAPAIFVAIVAVLAGAGGATAGTLITSAQIKDDSIRSVDVKDGGLRLRDLAPEAQSRLEGQKGETGAIGAIGASGATGATGATGAEGTVGAPGIPGAPGTPGTPGAPGTAGTNGAPGAPGARWLQGTDVPDSAAGTVGDWYLDTSTSDAYEKTATTTWTLRVNLKGADSTPAIGGWTSVHTEVEATGSTGHYLATGQADCPGDKLAISGGYILTVSLQDAFRVLRDQGGGTSWEVEAVSDQPFTVSIYALCADIDVT